MLSDKQWIRITDFLPGKPTEKADEPRIIDNLLRLFCPLPGPGRPGGIGPRNWVTGSRGMFGLRDGMGTACGTESLKRDKAMLIWKRDSLMRCLFVPTSLRQGP